MYRYPAGHSVPVANNFQDIGYQEKHKCKRSMSNKLLEINTQWSNVLCCRNFRSHSRYPHTSIYSVQVKMDTHRLNNPSRYKLRSNIIYIFEAK